MKSQVRLPVSPAQPQAATPPPICGALCCVRISKMWRANHKNSYKIIWKTSNNFYIVSIILRLCVCMGVRGLPVTPATSTIFLTATMLLRTSLLLLFIVLFVRWYLQFNLCHNCTKSLVYRRPQLAHRLLRSQSLRKVWFNWKIEAFEDLRK